MNMINCPSCQSLYINEMEELCDKCKHKLEVDILVVEILRSVEELEKMELSKETRKYLVSAYKKLGLLIKQGDNR